MKFAQIVMGPAGNGKSTYCSTLSNFGRNTNRVIDVVNLDPAAEYYDYETLADIRDLISVRDTMDEDGLNLGPNGGLLFCMEYLLQNINWLYDQLQDIDNDYILFDCPGQIELYTHLGIMQKFVEHLQDWGFSVCGIYILDSQFMIEPSKFFSGTLVALSTMINVEVPHINVLSKMDLLSKKARKRISRFIDADTTLLLESETDKKWGKNFQRLSEKIAGLIEDYSLVKYVPLNRNDEDSIQNLLIQIDTCLQYGDDLDVKTKDFDETFPDSGQESPCDD
ncbi:hypothetical protein CHUAL_004505 [Chamberlinius hualienensis]